MLGRCIEIRLATTSSSKYQMIRLGPNRLLLRRTPPLELFVALNEHATEGFIFPTLADRVSLQVSYRIELLILHGGVELEVLKLLGYAAAALTVDASHQKKCDNTLALDSRHDRWDVIEESSGNKNDLK